MSKWKIQNHQRNGQTRSRSTDHAGNGDGQQRPIRQRKQLLTAVLQQGERFGFAYVDLSTGELKAAQLEDEEAVVNEAAALQTKEVVLCSEIPESLQTTLTNRLNVVFSKQETLEENAEFQF